jgi:hypothetical protein
MFDKWYDPIEKQIDRFMISAENALIWASGIGIVLLIAAQVYLAWRG